jgi:hypothetical protein
VNDGIFGVALDEARGYGASEMLAAHRDDLERDLSAIGDSALLRIFALPTNTPRLRPETFSDAGSCGSEIRIQSKNV